MRDIIWINLDSVRYDHTTMSGYRRDTTPNLQHIADMSEGRSFSNCISPTYATRPFTASTLTGKFPQVVNIFENGTIPDGLIRVPERFAGVGYRTAGLSMNAHFGPSIGADKGFDRFRQNLPSNMLDLSLLPVYLKYAVNLPSNVNNISLNKWQYSTAYLMNEIGKQFLDSLHSRSAPFFFYAHYIEPHRPYIPPRPEGKEFTGSVEMSVEDATQFALRVHENISEVIASYCDLSSEEWEALLAVYDGELAHTDRMIGELFKYAHSIGIDDAVWVITADHGEMLGEHDFIGHKHFIDEPLVHVPMVTYNFDPDATTDQDVVQHLDVMKTLLSQSGASLDGIQGIDLDEDSREYTISYRGTESNFDIYYEHNPQYELEAFIPGRLFGVRSKQYKYFSNGEMTKLVRLPDEQTDISSKRPELVSEFEERLSNWKEMHDRPIQDQSQRELNPETVKQLNDLGYME